VEGSRDGDVCRKSQKIFTAAVFAIHAGKVVVENVADGNVGKEYWLKLWMSEIKLRLMIENFSSRENN
jgi:hypothetical protein